VFDRQFATAFMELMSSGTKVIFFLLLKC